MYYLLSASINLTSPTYNFNSNRDKKANIMLIPSFEDNIYLLFILFISLLFENICRDIFMN